MIFAIYNDHVIVFKNSDLKIPYVQTYHRPSDWFRNPFGFYLNISCEAAERAMYLHLPGNFRERTTWNTAIPEDNRSRPFAVAGSRGGVFHTLYKMGKQTVSAAVSDVKYGQNIIVSNDGSTIYAECDEELYYGEIKDIEEYIRRIHLISQSSTQGSYQPRAWYCTLEDFRKCLEMSEDQDFGSINALWKTIDFQDPITVNELLLEDIKPFTYGNLAGFQSKGEENV